MNEAGAVVGELGCSTVTVKAATTRNFRSRGRDLWIRVESAVVQRPVKPVTDITLVWDNAEGA